MRGEHFSEADIWPEVVPRLAAIPEYVERFDAAFGPGGPITRENVARAIASFERTLVNPSSFDSLHGGRRRRDLARRKAWPARVRQ